MNILTLPNNYMSCYYNTQDTYTFFKPYILKVEGIEKCLS